MKTFRTVLLWLFILGMGGAVVADLMIQSQSEGANYYCQEHPGSASCSP
jgi:hypothetical protein